MRRAIVHVGMPRCGSTTIQHVLARIRPRMEAAGVLYPDLTPASAAHEPHLNHQHFGEALDGRRPASEGRELLARLSDQLAATAADVVLLSYEDFIQEKRAGAIAAVLRTAFERHGFRMEAIVVAKPQGEHLNSIYSHRAQLMREKRLFDAFCRGFEGSRRFAYAELIEPWMAACSGRVRGIPLRDARSGAPLLDRFLIELGLQDRVLPLLEPADAMRVENRSPGPVAVEASRRLRLLRVHARLTVRSREVMRTVERGAQERGYDGVAFKGMDPARRSRLAERYALTNARFAMALWARPWAAVVADEPEHPRNEIGGPADPETERVIQTLMQQACARFGVTARRPWHASLAELAEDAAAAAQRGLRVSKWRVI